MRTLVVLIAIFFSARMVEAQIGSKLLKKAAEVGKDVGKDVGKKVATKAGENFLNRLDEDRKQFDSADFDYAILVSDNSGLLDLKNKGEARSTLKSYAGLTNSFLKNDDVSDEEKARFHREMGDVLMGNGWYKSTEKKYTLAQETYEAANLTEDLGYFKTLSSLGMLYSTMGRFTQAETFTAQALDLRLTKFGDNNSGVAASYNNYGVLHYNLGRYNEAEKDLSRSLAILAANNLRDAMPGAIAMNNQAILYQAVGRYDEAEKALKSAIDISSKLEKKKSDNRLKFLSNLALLYQQMGKYTDSENLYLRIEDELDSKSPDYAAMLNNQAALYMMMGKEDKVEELLKRSAAIYKKEFGEDNPAYAKASADLGNFYRMKARYAEAEPLLTKALSIREASLGKSHPLYVQSQEDLAILYWKNNAIDQAVTSYRDVMTKSLDFINHYFPPMSEAEKTKYWDVLAPRFQRFFNFALVAREKDPNAVVDLFNNRIATKALLLHSTNKVKQSIFSSGDAQLIKDYVAWLDQKEQLARLYAYSKEELSEQKINLDSIERATNAMEKKLSEKSKDFSQEYAAAPITFADIKKTLGDNEAVVEIIRLQSFDQNFTADSKYVALVVTKNSELPKIVVLPNGQQLETRYAKFYRNAIQQKIADDYSYDQYWAKIEPELQGKKVIYISPDGVYNQLNFNTLKKPSADYVINRFDLTILGNSKDLIALKSKKASVAKKNATLLGFPDYGGAQIAPLPGTKVEIDGVSKILKASGYQVSQFMEKNATEANLKNIKGPALLHIATHGYFLKDVDQQGGAFGVHLENANDNPLLRSGIMLAGASNTVSGKTSPDLQSNDNGILTAYEAMNLNLDGTSLIVLSACETGLGDVKAGEGVYGLQRSFLVAGAEALIMSLWKVDDAATQQLMTNFYTNWAKTGNKQKAFKDAQLQLMTKYKEPYYWGAFVMMGN